MDDRLGPAGFGAEREPWTRGGETAAQKMKRAANNSGAVHAAARTARRRSASEWGSIEFLFSMISSRPIPPQISKEKPFPYIIQQTLKFPPPFLFFVTKGEGESIRKPSAAFRRHPSKFFFNYINFSWPRGPPANHDNPPPPDLLPRRLCHNQRQ